jgi:hypothetical protein
MEKADVNVWHREKSVYLTKKLKRDCMKKVIAVLLILVVYAGFAFAGEKTRDGCFIAYDNGTVLDTKTNLMWAAKDNGSDIKWQDAKFYCENYHGGGYTDWRLPTLDELEGLYDASKSRPATCYGRNSIHVATELIDITCFLSMGIGNKRFRRRLLLFQQWQTELEFPVRRLHLSGTPSAFRQIGYSVICFFDYCKYKSLILISAHDY